MIPVITSKLQAARHSLKNNFFESIDSIISLRRRFRNHFAKEIMAFLDDFAFRDKGLRKTNTFRRNTCD
jgi:hypothetical protein